MKPEHRLWASLAASASLHALLLLTGAPAPNDALRSSAAITRAVTLHIASSIHGEHWEEPPSAGPINADSAPEPPAEPEVSFFPQSRLTRKTELLSPVELDALFPEGTSPTVTVRASLAVDASGNVVSVQIAPEHLQAQFEALSRTLITWVFVPGEINGVPVQSIVDIEFSPTATLPPKQ